LRDVLGDGRPNLAADGSVSRLSHAPEFGREVKRDACGDRHLALVYVAHNVSVTPARLAGTSAE
jgi:hypothetical protein